MTGSQWNKQGRFGMAVDLLDAAMKGLAVYTVLLITGFWGYQSGRGSFYPWFYLLIIPLNLLLTYIYDQQDGIRCVLFHLCAVAVWLMAVVFVRVNPVTWILACLLAAGESLFNKFVLGDTDTRRYVKRFKTHNYVRWGIVIWLSSFLLYSQSDPASEAFPLSVDACGKYITGAFVIYLVLVVMLKYVFQQYDHFRKDNGMDENTFRRLVRMNGIVAVVVTVLIVLSMFMATKTIVRAVLWLLEKILLWIASAGFLDLNKTRLKQFTGGNTVVPAEGKSGRPTRHTGEAFDSMAYKLVPVILIIALLYLLWKIYRTVAANYTIGDDQAEYIPRYEEKKMRLGSIHSGETYRAEPGNRGKIRKMYYKTMKKRMERAGTGQAKGKTPQELAQIYRIAGEGRTLEEIMECYEKARYSNEICQTEDVEKMRELTESS